MSRGTPGTAGLKVLLRLRGSHPLWRAFPVPFRFFPSRFLPSLTPKARRLPVWAIPRSLAATDGIDLSFCSSGYLDVSVRRVPPMAPRRSPASRPMVHTSSACGSPHSDIHGSLPVCGSPWLFAACHVFHRLPVPGHPPRALFWLTSLALSFRT